MAHTPSHDDYVDKLRRLADHIKAHPEEARAGVLKLSSGAQKPAGEILKTFVSDKDPKIKFDEIQKIKDSVSAPIRAEIDNHITDLAHYIGILTLHEIVQRLEKLADHIKAHPDETRARVAKLSVAAQKPFGELIHIFVSDKSARQKFEESQKIKNALPSDVLGEINALKEEIAKKIGIVPLHHIGRNTHSHDDYIDKLHRLSEHIKAHPEEARAGVAKLSSGAQKPAGDILKIFVSDKDVKTKFEEVQQIKSGLTATVRAEIENHTTDLAHKIGILTIHEIVERLEKLVDHIKAHPEQTRARVAQLSPAAQKPFGELIHIFVSDKTPREKFDECQKIQNALPSDVLAEINALKEEIAKKIGIVPIHHLGHTPSHDDYVDKLHRLADHIKAHPEEARAGVLKLSSGAQKPAGDILKTFVSDKDPKTIYYDIQNIKEGLSAPVRAEIENHITDLAHKIGILTIHEVVERLDKLAEHIKAHPDETRARVAQMSAAAQKPFGELIHIFVSNKSPREKFEESQKIKNALPADVIGEINILKEEIAKKIGIVPVHHLAHTPSHDDYMDKLHRLAEHIKAHPDEARAGVLKLSSGAQQPFGDIVKIFVSDKDVKTKFDEIQNIKAGLSAPVRAEIENHTTDIAHKIGILTIHEIIERLEKLADHIKAHPDETRARVAELSVAAQKPFGELIHIFVSNKTPREKFEECQKIKNALPSDVLGEINALKEQIARKIRITPLHHLSHTPAHDAYNDKIHRLIEHIKEHPEEARAGVAKLSSEAQKPAGEIIKIFVSDKDTFAKILEIEKIKAALSPSVRAEIENHKTELAHKIGILTLHEILERLAKLAEHIKAHPEEARAGIARLSAAAQKPAGDIIKIFCSDKTPRDKHEEIKKIKDALPSHVLGEINAHKEELARKLRITPLHHLGHTQTHDDYADKLHRLADHIKAHPEEARAGVAKLSGDAQQPAGEIIKIFVSDKDAFVKISEINKIKAGLTPAVRAEIEHSTSELAHKIGILTLHEILARLEKLADHIKAHPEEARAGVAKLSAAAQKPAGDIIKIFCSDKTPREKHDEIKKIKDALPTEVLGEINAHKEEIARKIRITPLHHLSHTQTHNDYYDKLHRLAEHIKAHPEEARAGVAKLSKAAQQPAGEIIRIFCSDKDAFVKISEIQKIKEALPAPVRAEIENHKADLAHKIGILTLHEIIERLEKLAEHIKAHPDEARAGVAKLSAAAQKPASEIIHILVSDKTPREKHEAIKKIKDSLPSDVLGEINAHKEEIAIKIGVTPLHHH